MYRISDSKYETIDDKARELAAKVNVPVSLTLEDAKKQVEDLNENNLLLLLTDLYIDKKYFNEEGLAAQKYIRTSLYNPDILDFSDDVESKVTMSEKEYNDAMEIISMMPFRADADGWYPDAEEIRTFTESMTKDKVKFLLWLTEADPQYLDVNQKNVQDYANMILHDESVFRIAG